MAKHIGIVACSAEGAALCYRTICLEASRAMGEHRHPEITMHNHCLADYMDHIRASNWKGVADLMLDSTRRVAGAGAELAICPDNTIHEALELVAADSPIPWLHIAEVVVKQAKRRGFRRLAVLGTRYLMEGPVYRRSLGTHGLDGEVPDEQERAEIDRIIFSELVNGVFTDESRDYFNRVIERLGRSGCDAAVLGCTEIPLIVRPDEAALPTLDSTRLLARAALAAAIKGHSAFS